MSSSVFVNINGTIQWQSNSGAEACTVEYVETGTYDLSVPSGVPAHGVQLTPQIVDPGCDAVLESISDGPNGSTIFRVRTTDPAGLDADRAFLAMVV